MFLMPFSTDEKEKYYEYNSYYSNNPKIKPTPDSAMLNWGVFAIYAFWISGKLIVNLVPCFTSLSTMIEPL